MVESRGKPEIVQAGSAGDDEAVAQRLWSGSAVTLKRAGHAGAKRIKFTGRIRHRALPTGSYVATFTAANVAGTSAPRSLRFKIVAR